VDRGNRHFVPSLALLYSDLEKWVPLTTTDDDLKDARIHGFIGDAECLYVSGRPNEAAFNPTTLPPLIFPQFVICC